MRLIHSLQLHSILILLLLAGCVHPISKETRQQIETPLSMAEVGKNPSAFVDTQLLAGGAIITTESDQEGTLLEIMSWHLNSLGEPLYPEESGQRFLIRTSEPLDSTLYEPGVLVTLSAVVTGEERRFSGETEYAYPVLNMTEIHLWQSPFRYGRHGRIPPTNPEYVDPGNDPHRHPYDPGYRDYPYTPTWHRDRGY